MIEDKNKKTRCPKKYQITAREVSEIAGCSESYVKKLRSRLVSIDSPLARGVLAIDLLAKDGTNALIQEIERIITLP